jgi:RNA polymerase sigma-B factor
VASLGLIKAVERFDPGRGRPFIGFAAPTILGELKRYFRDTGWSVHVPRGMLELALRMQIAVDELARLTGRSPSVAELAAHLDLDPDQVLDGLEAAAARYADSLDAPGRGAEDEPAGVTTVLERTGRDDSGYEAAEVRGSVGIAIRRLPVLERRALALRLEGELKQSEIADALGCSQMQVSRLLRRGADRLAAELNPELLTR